MALVTEKPEDVAGTNALDEIPDDLISVPPAYLSFGSTPSAIEDPPAIDDTEIYIVRVRCVGESRSERTDGEMRHGRKLQIQWAVKKGQPEPPNPDEEQPALFDHDGEVPEDAGDEQWDYEQPEPQSDEK